VSDMNILMTGSTGFIGRHLLHRLQREGYFVDEFLDDLTIPSDVSRKLQRRYDVVIHLGALTFVPSSWDVPESYMEVNTMGTLNILKNHRMWDSLIHFSTSHVYGLQTKFPITEDSRPNPLDPYSVSKLAGEHLAHVYCMKYKKRLIILRPFNNFGEGQRETFLIPSLIKRACTNEPYIPLEVRGNSMRDYLYVENTCDAVVKIVEKLSEDESFGRVSMDDYTEPIFNVCSGECLSTLEIAEKVNMLVNGIQNVKLVESDRELDIPKLHGSYEKLSRVVGWSPRIDFDDGLRRTVNAYLKRWR